MVKPIDRATTLISDMFISGDRTTVAVSSARACQALGLSPEGDSFDLEVVVVKVMPSRT